ncbi:MAG TPA: hypothetical protein VGB54_09510 [Allosphingosinicella sp.]
MTEPMTYQRLMETSQRVAWRVDDVIGARMDFSRPLLPESFARTADLAFLTPPEQLQLNHVRAHGYLCMFELVERCILPFINENVPSAPDQDAYRTPALAQFAAEEEKHIELFVRFRDEFRRDFGTECGFIGPADEIGAAIRGHGELALSIFVLAIEWATQRHYLESIRDDASLDPQFKSLLKHHWLEESQHAKLDALVFFELAGRSSAEDVEAAVEEFLDIGGFIDAGLKQQAELDLASLQLAIGRQLEPDQRETFLAAQHQAMRWTFLGSALVNKGFLEALGRVSGKARSRIEQVAPVFC